MNREEAEKVLKILRMADGGCEYCVSSLLELFSKEFPQFRKLVEKFKPEFEGFINKTTHCTKEERQKYYQHGWDDEKVYFWG